MDLLAVLQQLNWIDLIIVILLFRLGYISKQKGFPTEVFKILGTLLAIYLSLHYYSALSAFLLGHSGLDSEALDFLNFISFGFLVVTGYLVFVLVRLSVNRFLKMEAVPHINMWGGFAVGVIRSLLLASLILFMLLVTGADYFTDTVKSSYLGRREIRVCVNTYTALWEGLFSKFMPQEKFNASVLAIQKQITK